MKARLTLRDLAVASVALCACAAGLVLFFGGHQFAGSLLVTVVGVVFVAVGLGIKWWDERGGANQGPG